jgi:hypothetical protein
MRPRANLNERLGLWLAHKALLISGNRRLAHAALSLPEVVGQRLLTLSEPADHSRSQILREKGWMVWRDPHQQSQTQTDS